MEGPHPRGEGRAMGKQVFYGIMLPDNSLARYYRYANRGNCCGEHTYTLTNSPSDPEWLVEDPDAVAATLFSDTPWYNSDEHKPRWGMFKREQMRPAKVIIETTIEPTEDVHIPANIDTIEARTIPWGTAKRYAGRDDLPQKNYTFVLSRTPLDEAQRCIGKTACFGDWYTRRVVIAAVSVPDDYLDMPENPQSLLICDTPDT